ncbi:MAG: alanine racemase [Alphaproteobacteria bacterium]|nr:alanine racemase [Alphaproteobacteria bacterium]
MPEATLTIDLGAVRQNYRILQAKFKGAIGGVVKANGYGLGAQEIAGALYREGCRDFFVSSLEEGVRLRKYIQDARVIVLNGFYGSGADLYAGHNLVPAIGSFMEIEGYKKLGQKHGKKLEAWLSFNTRMNRLGLGAVETEKLLENMEMLEGINVTGIMSHFACADEAGHPLNDTQYEIFDKIARHFPQAKKSLCNSSAIFRDVKYHYDIARPGMALYGLNPTPEAKNPMQPVVSLQVPVIRVRLVYKDAVVGYGATYKFDRDTWIATVAAGYADGIFRSLSNKGALYWKGYRCPIRGRVSMDLTTVDLSAVPESERPKPGDSMELIGGHQGADDLARDAGTIGYEILTALGQRYKRNYVGSTEPVIRISGGKSASDKGA